MIPPGAIRSDLPDRPGAVDRPTPVIAYLFRALHDWSRKLARHGLQHIQASDPPGSVVDSPLPRTGIHRILICRPNHRLGNLLLLTPLLAELQHSYPGAQVDLVVGGQRSNALFQSFPNVGSVFRLPRHAFRQPLKFLRVLLAVRRERYDLAIDPDVRSRSSRLLLGRCRTTYRIGFSGIKSAQGLTHAMPIPVAQRHMGQLPVLLLRWAMSRRVGNPTDVPSLDLSLFEHERIWGRQRLAELLDRSADDPLPPVVALFTHATGAKRYEDAWWMQLFATLHARFPNHAFLEILPVHGHASLAGLVPAYYSSSPRRLASIIAAAQLFVTADCGVMHLACAASGPRVIGLFQRTDPAVYGPYGSGNRAISTLGHSAAELGADIARSGSAQFAGTDFGCHGTAAY